jgi:hypothetical protein
MKVRHYVEIRATCPVNGDADRYDAFVYVEGRVLRCEDVAEAVEQLTREPVYQETLTQALADRLGAKVKTVGRHTAGNVLTTVLCWPGRGGRCG